MSAAESLRCADCGYGIARTSPPERCPMCGGLHWTPLSTPQQRERADQEASLHELHEMKLLSDLEFQIELAARASSAAAAG